MKFTRIVFKMALALALLVVALSGTPQSVAAQVAIPEGATIDSATLFVHVDYVTYPQTVNVHRIIAPWDEGEVTWNSFAGSYDKDTVFGSFDVSVPGSYSVDVTALVQAWVNGLPNYGLLLKQGSEKESVSVYWSSDSGNAANHPALVICVDGTCFTMQRGTLGEVADAFIWDLYPERNYGTHENLYTGLVDGYQKQSLIRFDFEVSPPVLGALGDRVWEDLDRDGIQDPGEPGISGVTVELYDCEGNLLAATVTDGSGYYLFDGLPPGDYFVTFIPPEGYVFSPWDQGSDDAADSDADPATGQTVCTVLEPGETDLTWDAGLYRPPDAPGAGCTPGYWKNHEDSWPATGYSTEADFDDTFGVDLFDPDITLWGAVWARGGKNNRLARHGTAALLSAAHPDVNYPIGVAEVILAVQAGDADTLEMYNELGCSID